MELRSLRKESRKHSLKENSGKKQRKEFYTISFSYYLFWIKEDNTLIPTLVGGEERMIWRYVFGFLYLYFSFEMSFPQ